MRERARKKEKKRAQLSQSYRVGVFVFFCEFSSKTPFQRKKEQRNEDPKKKIRVSKVSSAEAEDEVKPPKNGVIALWPNTREVKCKYYVSQKQNRFNNNIHWYTTLPTLVFKFTARL